MNDACREAFEKWFSEPPLVRDGDGYRFSVAQSAWMAWQAAWNARGEHDAENALAEMVRLDQEMGLYDNPSIVPVRYVDGGKLLGEQIVTEVPSDS